MVRLLVTKQSLPTDFLVRRVCGWIWTPSRIKRKDCVQRAFAERDSDEICYLHSPWTSAAAVWTDGSFSWHWSCSPDSLSEGVSWVEAANGPTTCLVVAARWSASQGDGDGPRICLGDGQTEAPGVLSESGGSDALLWRILPYLTSPDLTILFFHVLGVYIKRLFKASNNSFPTI